MKITRALFINRGGLLILDCLLLFFSILSVSSVINISSTYDEATHYAYGEQILQGNSQRTGIHGDSNMPFSALNAIPERIGLLLPSGPIRTFLMNFQTARCITLLFSAMVALLVFHWSKSLYGVIPAFVSFILYIFDPNIIAHSQLVTTDIYAAGMTAFVFYSLWKFARSRTLVNGLVFSFLLGLSQLAKYTAIALIPLCLLTLFLHDLSSLLGTFQTADNIKKFTRRYFGYMAVAAIVLVLTINLGFLFNRTFTNFGGYKLRSDWFQAVQYKYPILRDLPVPFPFPYLDGIDWMRHTQTSGGNSGPAYLFGKLSRDGFPGYYIAASFLKVPISSQIVIIAAFLLYITKPDRRRTFLQNEIFLFTAILFYVVYFNFFFNVQIGIRYYLIIYPLLYIFAGSLFMDWNVFPVISKILSYVLLAYLVLSVLSYYPYYLTYFNEIVWNRTTAYKYLADSNIDWGQSSLQLTQYMNDHPEAILEPQTIQPGLLIVGINDLVGVTDDPAKFSWLRNNFEPVGTIANSILIYRVSPGDIEKLDLTK